MTENKRFKMVIADDDGNFHYLDKVTGEKIRSTMQLEDKLNELNEENEKLKEENKHYKYVLRDLGLLMSDEEVRDIRIEIADKIIKPLCNENGFDVDVDCTKGFTIIPKR